MKKIYNKKLQDFKIGPDFWDTSDRFSSVLLCQNSISGDPIPNEIFDDFPLSLNFCLLQEREISSLEGSDRQCTSPVAFVIWLWKADRTKSASDVGHAFFSVFWKTNKTNKTQLSVKLYVCLRFRYIITWTDYLLTFYEHFVWYPDFVYFSVVWSISMKITISN